MAKRGSGAVVIEQPRNHKEIWLLDTVKELSQKAGIKMPEVAIFPAHEANAFATGWNKNDALVAVSSGMLDRFSPDEIKAVLGHEIGHVANGDMITLSLIQGVVNTFVMFFARIAAYAVDQFLRKDDNEGSVGWGYYIATFVFEIIFGILASMIVMWFSRFREFRADEAGARLAGKGAMIAALARLQRTRKKAVCQILCLPSAFVVEKNLRWGNCFQATHRLKIALKRFKHFNIKALQYKNASVCWRFCWLNKDKESRGLFCFVT